MATALNRGLELATGEFVVSKMDADAAVETPRWTERMLADGRVGAVTPMVVYDTG